MVNVAGNVLLCGILLIMGIWICGADEHNSAVKRSTKMQQTFFRFIIKKPDAAAESLTFKGLAKIYLTINGSLASSGRINLTPGGMHLQWGKTFTLFVPDYKKDLGDLQSVTFYWVAQKPDTTVSWEQNYITLDGNLTVIEQHKKVSVFQPVGNNTEAYAYKELKAELVSSHVCCKTFARALLSKCRKTVIATNNQFMENLCKGFAAQLIESH